jgi:diaminopimelate epimerase
MPKIKFSKMVASGNDFVVLAGKPRQAPAYLAKAMCERKFGVGADGLLLLEKSRKADISMRVFNADGSEAEMCGNGARCAILWAKNTGGIRKSAIRLETRAGIIDSRISGGKIRIKLTGPRNLKLDFAIKINQRTLHLSFINTGVPHAVVFSDDIDNIDVCNLGRQLRYHKYFAPGGTNADFVEALNRNSLRIRTYERGVEDETLACGTGSVAAALIFALKGNIRDSVNVYTRSSEVLKVYFERSGRNFKNVWLEGKARIVYQGAYYV